MSGNPRNRGFDYIHQRRTIQPFINLSSGVGLEIGAFDRPIFTNEDGTVKFLDYRSTDDIKEYATKARGHSPDWVVDIDYVVPGSGDWGEVPNDHFDWILSSHALEHCPNLIGFLRTIASKLKPGGIVASVLPDKTSTFDVFRPITTLGKILEDFITHRTSPGYQAVFDHLFYKKDLGSAAPATYVGEYRKQTETLADRDNIEFAMKEALKSLNSYYDTHNYIFTSASFERIAEHLCKSNLIPFKILRHEHTVPNDYSFISIMQKV